MNEHAMNTGFILMIICCLLLSVGASTMRNNNKQAGMTLTYLLGLAAMVSGAPLGIWGLSMVIGSFT